MSIDAPNVSVLSTSSKTNLVITAALLIPIVCFVQVGITVPDVWPILPMQKRENVQDASNLMPIANFVRIKINARDVYLRSISLTRHQDCALYAVKHKRGANYVNRRIIAHNV